MPGPGHLGKDPQPRVPSSWRAGDKSSRRQAGPAIQARLFNPNQEIHCTLRVKGGWALLFNLCWRNTLSRASGAAYREAVHSRSPVSPLSPSLPVLPWPLAPWVDLSHPCNNYVKRSGAHEGSVPRTVSALHPCLLHFTPPTIATPKAINHLPITLPHSLPWQLAQLHPNHFLQNKGIPASSYSKISFGLPHHQDKDNGHTLAYHGWLAMWS